MQTVQWANQNTKINVTGAKRGIMRGFCFCFLLIVKVASSTIQSQRGEKY